MEFFGLRIICHKNMPEGTWMLVPFNQVDDVTNELNSKGEK